jgi:hypothetical protein
MVALPSDGPSTINRSLTGTSGAPNSRLGRRRALSTYWASEHKAAGGWIEIRGRWALLALIPRRGRLLTVPRLPKGVGAAFALTALVAAGCSSTPSASTVNHMPSRHLTAVEESASWFEAVNAKDRTASLAYFIPQDRHLADWNGGDVSHWPTFTNVNCNSIRSTSSTASVRCTFASHGDPSSAGDTFWSIDMQRAPGGPWLINSYGQP